MAEEPRYTLAEAKLALNEEECKRRGHRYGISVAVTEDGRGEVPVSLECERCGRRWKAGPEEPDAPRL